MENEYDQQFILYNSQVCRLCCVENANGSMLFLADEDDISVLINTYLPIKVCNLSSIWLSMHVAKEINVLSKQTLSR